MKKKTAKQKKLSFDLTRGDLRKGMKFLFGTAIAFAVFYAASLFIPLRGLELLIAKTVGGSLQLLGFTVSYLAEQEPVLMNVNDKGILISYLCTGLLEAIVLSSCIAASLGIPREKRITGIVLGIAGIFIFNIFRILATILAIFQFNLEIANLAHEVFFRAFLFLVIAGFYAAWFLWATGTWKPGFLSKKRGLYGQPRKI